MSASINKKNKKIETLDGSAEPIHGPAKPIQSAAAPGASAAAACSRRRRRTGSAPPVRAAARSAPPTAGSKRTPPGKKNPHLASRRHPNWEGEGPRRRRPCSRAAGTAACPRHVLPRRICIAQAVIAVPLLLPHRKHRCGLLPGHAVAAASSRAEKRAGEEGRREGWPE